MAWDAKLSWAGEFTGHSIQHDLEAFVWLMWVFCINLDGPFNRGKFKFNDFDKPEHLSSTMKHVRLEDLTAQGGVNPSNSSHHCHPWCTSPPTSQSFPAPTTVNLTTDKPPVEVAHAPSAICQQSAHKYAVPSITCSVDLVIVLF